MEMPSETESIEVSIMEQHVAASEDHPHSRMTVELHYCLYINSNFFFFRSSSQ
jgi:hypothetical protein